MFVTVHFNFNGTGNSVNACEYYTMVSKHIGQNNLTRMQTFRQGFGDVVRQREFLKEAVLMSNFRHDHIIRLLGVCLDSDPQYIILELMEGGDLLTYLRHSRATEVHLLLFLLPVHLNSYCSFFLCNCYPTALKTKMCVVASAS